MLHLDIKPRNIIVGPVPRLMDISIARRFEEVASIRNPLGTDAYMAPEQSDRTTLATIGPAADVWGIGVTMHQAASKKLPTATPISGDAQIPALGSLAVLAAAVAYRARSFLREDRAEDR